MTYIVDQDELSTFTAYRSALKAFLQRPDAEASLSQNPAMQHSLLSAFLVHYHPDAATGRVLLEREDISAVVVTTHKKWNTPCFGVVLRDGRCETFSISKKRFRPERRPAALSPHPVTTGQHTRNVYEALRHAVEPDIESWGRANPVPEACPVTSKPMGPLADRAHPLLRTLPATPSIDHHTPTFRELVYSFLQSVSLTMPDLELVYSPEQQTWVLADPLLRQAWVAHHVTGKLRWVSQEGQRRLNQQHQRGAGH